MILARVATAACSRELIGRTMRPTNWGGGCLGVVFCTPRPRRPDCNPTVVVRLNDELRQQQVALDVIVMLKGMQQALDRRLALARAGEVRH
jgi:hypothetical protein